MNPSGSEIISDGDTAASERFAIIRLSSLGDIIHTLPAFHQLRKHYPSAWISWLVEPLGGKLLKSFSGIDHVFVVDPKVKGLVEKFKEMVRIRRSGNGVYDWILDFQGLLKSALISSRLVGKRAGFHKSNLRESAARFFYHHNPIPFDEKHHVVYKNLHLLSLLGIESKEVSYPSFDLTPSDALTAWLASQKITHGGYVILNVGGGWDTKKLSVEQYAEIVTGLQSHCRIFLLWGTDKERKIAEAVHKITDAPIAPFFDFSDLILLLREASHVITSDTLPLHIADMVKTPSVGIFGPTSPQRNGSLLGDSIAVQSEVPCRFCYKKKCDKIDCLKELDPNDVVTASRTIYEKFR